MEIRILHVVPTFGGFDGLSQTVMNTIESLHRDFQIQICAVGWMHEKRRRELANLGVEAIAFEKASLFTLLKFMCLVRVFKPHIVHTHDFMGCLYGVGSKWFYDIPVTITTLHGDPNRYQKWKLILLRFLLRKTDKVICVSHAIRKECIKIFKLPFHKFVTIYNGVNLERFNPDQVVCEKITTESEKGNVIIGTVGRLFPFKGHQYLIRAMTLVLQQVTNVNLWIIGDGPLRQFLESLVAELGISEYVVFLGEHADIPQLILQMDIFVLPSLTEGLPLTVLEALAMEKPVIASNVGGIPEFIEDSYSGILVEPRDSAGLAHVILKLLSNKEKAKELAANGRRLVSTHFSSEYIASQIAALYTNCLQNLSGFSR